MHTILSEVRNDNRLHFPYTEVANVSFNFVLYIYIFFQYFDSLTTMHCVQEQNNHSVIALS